MTRPAVSRQPAVGAGPLPRRSLLAGLSSRDPDSPEQYQQLLTRLWQAGRQDLASARLLEGHIDALQLIRRYGRTPASQALADQIEATGWCGVWNADLRGNPLRLEAAALRGGKAFASGAGWLTHALVTLEAGDRERVQLVLVDLSVARPRIDTEWWDVVGMQASHTHKVDWNGSAEGVMLIGDPGDYEREPWFSGGALRYAAAQAGGIAALFEAVRGHLITKERDRDPHQLARLARLYSSAELAATLCRQSATVWFETEGDTRRAYVAHVRLTVSDLAVSAITLAQEAIGLEALFRAHPASGILTDLMVYIRQPGPDRSREILGKAAAMGCLDLSL